MMLATFKELVFGSLVTAGLVYSFSCSAIEME